MAEQQKPSSLTVNPQESSKEAAPKSIALRIRFWGTFAALCILSFISALDVAIITTALPRITEDIGGASQYVWIANSFVVASSVPQPLVGQLANLYGRRTPFLVSIALFILGSGIAGGAINPAMLIAGRTVQGLGAGGIYMLLDIVCCDLVSLRERAKYLGLMFSWSGVAAGLGPVLGGVLAEKNWRWIFYLNIPICSVAMIAMLCFMRMKTGADMVDVNQRSRFRQVDLIGNLIFVPSIIAVLLGLVTGGIQHPWSSWRVIVPLVLGFLGWAAFHVQQSFAKFPSIPGRLFKTRTSAAGFILTFFSSMLVQMVGYFLPIYFQGVHGTTVVRSGVSFLPFAISTLGFAVVAGVLLGKTGVYRPIHAVAFAVTAIGYGLLTLLSTSTKTVVWTIFQLVAGAGAGMTLPTILPAILAALPESDVASSTAAFNFVKSFGFVWGITVPAIIFNAEINRNLYLVSDATLKEMLKDGTAYSFASQAHFVRDQFSATAWHEVLEAYVRSIRTIWWVGMGLSIVAFLFVGMERGLELRTELNTEYGLEDENSVNKKTITNVRVLEKGRDSESASAHSCNGNVLIV